MCWDTPRMNSMTTAELADYLKVEPKTLANWRYQGKGPAYLKNGGIVRYRLADVAAWIREHTIEPSNDR